MRKKSSILKKVIKFIIFLIILFFIFNNLMKMDILNKYKVNIGDDTNKNYSAEGKTKIEGKDGYQTVFKSENRTYNEYKQNEIASWAQNSYWGGTMEENGCGITAMSIILSGYGIKETPEDLRKKYFPHLDGEDICKELKGYGIDNSDFVFSTVYFSKSKIIKHLEKDKPILICVWDKPDLRWTEKSHYMVLLATDGKNKVYVSNPNGTKYESASGWYETGEILPYIAKALFIEE